MTLCGTLCDKVNAETAAKLLPGEPDFQDFGIYMKIMDEIGAARDKISAEIRRIDTNYRQNKTETPQFERDDLDALEYGSHFAIVERYGLKVCHISALREFANALGCKWVGSFHAMDVILAGRKGPEDKKYYAGQLRKCSENGGCPTPNCEYRVENIH